MIKQVMTKYAVRMFTDISMSDSKSAFESSFISSRPGKRTDNQEDNKLLMDKRTDVKMQKHEHKK